MGNEPKTFLQAIFAARVADAETIVERIHRESAAPIAFIEKSVEGIHHPQFRHLAEKIADWAKRRISGSMTEEAWQSFLQRTQNELVGAISRSRLKGGFAAVQRWEDPWASWSEARHAFLWSAGCIADTIRSAPIFQALILSGIENIDFARIRCTAGDLTREMIASRCANQKELPTPGQIARRIEEIRVARANLDGGSGWMDSSGKKQPFHANVAPKIAGGGAVVERQ